MKKSASIYQLEGRVSLQQAVPLGIQHVLAMFLGNISPLIIVAGLLDMDALTKAALIQNAMFVAGVVTLLQLYPIWKVGSGLPAVMGTSSGFIGTANAIGTAYGYGGIIGASLIGALVEMVLGFFIQPLKKLFPPVVTSLVVIAIGLSLLPVGVSYFGGGSSSADFGSINHLLVGTVVLVSILALQQVRNAFVRASAILGGILIGYVVAICLGMVDFTQVTQAAWISLPQIMPIMPTFHADAIIAMCIMYVATAVETIGDTTAITVGGLYRQPTDRELEGSVLADGVGSMFAAVFGIMPNTTFSQNVGLVAMTKVVNRFVIAVGATFLILCGFCPKLSALFSVMPQSVLGGAAILMFGMIFVSGLRSLMAVDLSGRNGVIVAMSIGLGVGIGNLPTVLAQLPSWVTNIFAQNGLIMTFVIATLLNVILPQDKIKPTTEGNTESV